MSNNVKAAIAIIVNEQGEILISQRPFGVYMAGKWEFPGGKIEPFESPEEALKRECFEELDIHVTECAHLLSLEHTYPEYTVELEVWRVTAYEGKVCGRESQRIAWVTIDALEQYDLLEACTPIIDSILSQM
ncbi:MAG: 8-oxo-dGTP diphosphatase MutT [Gammaproteobacteria bacterium]